MLPELLRKDFYASHSVFTSFTNRITHRILIMATRQIGLYARSTRSAATVTCNGHMQSHSSYLAINRCFDFVLSFHYLIYHFQTGSGHSNWLHFFIFRSTPKNRIERSIDLSVPFDSTMKIESDLPTIFKQSIPKERTSIIILR